MSLVDVSGEAVGVGEREGVEGGFPALDLGAFDELARGFALSSGQARFFRALPGSFVFDVADREPEQLDHGVVGGEVAAVLDDLAELVVQRLDRVGTGYESGRRLTCSYGWPGPWVWFYGETVRNRGVLGKSVWAGRSA